MAFKIGKDELKLRPVTRGVIQFALNLLTTV